MRRLDERLRDPAVVARLDAARAEAAAAARVLRERFGATRVRLFGSLARRDRAEGFDIDLAVEGIAARDFFRACAAADQVVTRRLDIVDVAEAPPLLRARIDEDGVELP
jgi:hypothetical protein